VCAVGVEPTQPEAGGLQPPELTYVQDTHGAGYGIRTRTLGLEGRRATVEHQTRMERLMGLKPTTFSLARRRSNQLS
jgi:hypothetical protein